LLRGVEIEAGGCGDRNREATKNDYRDGSRKESRRCAGGE
jgi:hypothetical protein